MDLEDVDSYLTGLDGIRRRRADGRTTWSVDGLLVARTDAPGTLVVRAARSQRGPLLTAHPDTSGVPPRWEAHDKIQADLNGDAEAIRRALHLDWDRQRHARRG